MTRYLYLLAIVMALIWAPMAYGQAEYLSNMTEDTTPEADDLLYCVDDDLASGVRRHKVQVGNLGKAAGAGCAINADCSTFTAEGLMCWDSDNDALYVGNGASAIVQGAGALGSTIDDTEMTAEDFGDFTCTGLEDGCAIDASFTCADLDTTDCGAITASSFIGPLTGNADTATTATTAGSAATATTADTATTAGTANALAANGANCPAGEYPLGVDDEGAVESCTPAAGSGTITAVWNDVSGDVSAIVAEAGDSFDASVSDYSIPFRHLTDCSAVVEEGRACWDTDDDDFYIGDGVGTVEIGAGGAGTITDIMDCNTGDCNALTVGTGEWISYGTGYIDVNRFMGVTTVDATEFGYLNGVAGLLYYQGGTDVADADVEDSLTVTAQTGSTWAVADSVAVSSVYSATTSLEEITAADDSGAYIVGVYDEFSNSDSTNVQGALNDLDDAIVAGGVAWCSIGNATAACELGFSTYAQTIQSYADTKSILEIYSRGNNNGDTTHLTLSHDDSNDANVFFMKGVEDKDGANTTLWYIDYDGVYRTTGGVVATGGASDFNALTIGSAYIYRAGGTDVPVTDGGTGVSTFTDGGILIGNSTSGIVATAVLTDGQVLVGDGTTDPVAESGATLRTSIGVGTGDSPEFTAIELGNATDTSITRSGAGAIQVEGVAVSLLGPTIGAAEMADGDHGHASWTSGSVTVEDFALNAPADGGDQNITNLGDLAIDSLSADVDNGPVYVGDGADQPIIRLDGTPAADDTYTGTVITSVNCGENVAQWDWVYMDDTANEWMLADANAAGKFPAVGMATAACTDGNPGTILIQGVVTNAGWAATITGDGKALYLAETAGGITETQPSDSTDCVQHVARVLSETGNTILVNPNTLWVELQ